MTGADSYSREMSAGRCVREKRIYVLQHVGSSGAREGSEFRDSWEEAVGRGRARRSFRVVGVAGALRDGREGAREGPDGSGRPGSLKWKERSRRRRQQVQLSRVSPKARKARRDGGGRVTSTLSSDADSGAEALFRNRLASPSYWQGRAETEDKGLPRPGTPLAGEDEGPPLRVLAPKGSSARFGVSSVESDG